MDNAHQQRIDAWEAHKPNKAAAARACGIPASTFKSWLERQGLEDQLIGHKEPVPGFGISKISTYYGKDGEPTGQWVQQKPDEIEREAARQAAYEAMAAELPRVEPVAPPAITNDRLCTVYTLTDAHIGMLAWKREGGADWDLNIAERTILGCMAEAIRGAPHSKVAVLNQLGDLLHHDGLAPITPTSGHILDADGRFTKMVEVAVRVLRQTIDMILAKHERLHLILAEGNHDIASSVWLRTMFKALYENEPRITVDDSALPYYAYQHGKTMLAFHHSHLKKFAASPGFFAAQFPVMWGATTKRYCHTGNLHHRHEKEDGGMLITQHPTLAARDAYAARGGWFAERGMLAITYDIEFGEVGRNIVTPEMLAA